MSRPSLLIFAEGAEMPERFEKCGTPVGAYHHAVRNERACEACKAARAEYERERKAKARNGKPASMFKPTLRERLLSKATINWETGCWEWVASKNRGYGRIGIGGGKWRFAHRVAYELIEGPIPADLELDHLCRNPSCINPAHLEPVTGRINTLRSNGVSALNARKTHCPAGHEYTPDNIYQRPDRPEGRARHCLACRQDSTDRWNAKVKAERAARRAARATT